MRRFTSKQLLGKALLSHVCSSRFRRVGSEFFWIAFGQVFVAAGSLLGLSLLTRALSPESYGELALGLTAAVLAQQVATGPLAGAFLRFYSTAAEGGKFPDYLLASKRLMGIATVAILSVAFAIAVAFAVAGHTRWISLLATAAIFSLLSGYNTALDAIQTGARQRSLVALHQGANQWLRFSLALGLISWLGASSTVAMMGFALASLAVLVSQDVFFRRRVVVLHRELASPDRPGARFWTSQMTHYAWPIALCGVFTWAQLSADRWALQLTRSPREVGLYAALYQLGYSPMVLLSSFMVQLSSPILFSRAGDGTDHERVAHSNRLHGLLVTALACIASVAVLAAWRFHAQIFSLFVAPDYRLLSPLLPVMVIASALFCLGQAATLSLLAGLNTKPLLSPKIGTAILGVLLSFAGARSFGASGVVYASALTAAIYLVWILLLVCRHQRLITPASRQGIALPVRGIRG